MGRAPLSDNALSVVVFGAGSIGLYCGGQLAYAGCNISFIGRPRFAEALKEGLTLSHYSRPTLSVSPERFDFFTDIEAARRALVGADIVLVCVKSQDSTDAARALRPYIKPDVITISFQNGVRNVADLSAGLGGKGCVLGAVVPFNVTQTGPAQWHCGTEGDLTIAAREGDSRLDSFAAAYARSGHGVTYVDDIAAAQWGKLLVNLNNGLNTLTGGTLMEGLVQRPYRLVLAAMIEEGVTLLSRGGITPAAFGKASPQKMLKILRLPNWLYRMIMQKIVKIDAAARSSMLDDLVAGKPCEIAYLQGEIVALAARLGTQAPMNAKVQAMVEDAFKAGRSPKLSGQDIYSAVMGR